MATQQPSTKLTIISGRLRGRHYIHVADVFEPSISSTVPGTAYWGEVERLGRYLSGAIRS